MLQLLRRTRPLLVVVLGITPPLRTIIRTGTHDTNITTVRTLRTRMDEDVTTATTTTTTTTTGTMATRKAIRGLLRATRSAHQKNVRGLDTNTECQSPTDRVEKRMKVGLYISLSLSLISLSPSFVLMIDWRSNGKIFILSKSDFCSEGGAESHESVPRVSQFAADWIQKQRFEDYAQPSSQVTFPLSPSLLKIAFVCVLFVCELVDLSGRLRGLIMIIRSSSILLPKEEKKDGSSSFHLCDFCVNLRNID